jgi:hypothetical protein
LLLFRLAVRIWFVRIHPTGVDAGYSAAPDDTARFHHDSCDGEGQRKKSGKKQ